MKLVNNFNTKGLHIHYKSNNSSYVIQRKGCTRKFTSKILDT